MLDDKNIKTEMEWRQDICLILYIIKFKCSLPIFKPEKLVNLIKFEHFAACKQTSKISNFHLRFVSRHVLFDQSEN